MLNIYQIKSEITSDEKTLTDLSRQRIRSIRKEMNVPSK